MSSSYRSNDMLDALKLDAGLRKEVEVEVMGSAATSLHYFVVERCKWSLAGNEGGVGSNLRLVTSTTSKRGGVAALWRAGTDPESPFCRGNNPAAAFVEAGVAYGGLGGH